jgi:hypothetical protein
MRRNLNIEIQNMKIERIILYITVSSITVSVSVV